MIMESESEPFLPGAETIEIDTSVDSPPVPRRKGRPTNAEYLAQGKVPPRTGPAPGTASKAAPRRPHRKRVPTAGPRRRTAAEYEKATGDLLNLITFLVARVDQVDGEILAVHSPALAHGVGQLAHKNDLVGAWLDRLETSSDIGLVVAPLGAICLGIAAHHGLLGNTPLAGYADPYEQAVANANGTPLTENEPASDDLAAAS